MLFIVSEDTQHHDDVGLSHKLGLAAAMEVALAEETIKNK